MTPIRDAFVRTFERAESKAAWSLPPKPGETAAVFAPGAAGVIAHELIGHALEGDVVACRRSWIANGGLSAPSIAVTVADDPRRGRGAWLIDDEGTAALETRLIEHNRQVGLLLDRAAAAALGQAPTGHGRRSSYLDRIQPRMGCTFIESGADDPIDILRSTRAGVFIHRLSGGHTDPNSGRATFVVTESDRVIDGRLAGPLDDFVIELRGPESWRSIDRIAHDLEFDTCVGSCVRDGQPLAVSVGAPTIRIGVVRVCC
jgi:TldD protein